MTVKQFKRVLDLFNDEAYIEMLCADEEHYSDPLVEVSEYDEASGFYRLVISPDLPF